VLEDFLVKMNLNPMNRETMRQLKFLKDEEIRHKRINQVIEEIYINAVEQAMNNTQTSYRYQISAYDKQFYTKNITEIIERLQYLFPDCIVKDTLMFRGKDRRTYGTDIMDTGFIKSAIYSYIVIDWT